MIKIKILCPAIFHNDSIDEYGYMVLEEGAILRDALKKLNIKWPINKFINYNINGYPAELVTSLKDGDEIAVFSVISGG